MTHVDEIYEFMQQYALTAGKILARYRGKVSNKGKDPAKLVGGEQSEGGLALSVVDEIIQEGFLWELSTFPFAPGVRINCEENTTLTELFRGNTGEICTVHQDPCDGTKPYLDGKNDFATGYGISDPRNNFTHTVIYVPAQERLYIASPTSARVLNSNLEEVARNSQPPSNKIFSKRVLNARGKEEAAKLGLVVEGVESAHCRIVDVAMGNATAYLYGLANPHDSFVPYAFARANNVGLTDIEGKKLTGKDIVVVEKDGFASFERVPSVVYIRRDSPYKEDLMGILSDTRNLDADMAERYW